MKNISIFIPDKYKSNEYEDMGNGCYLYDNRYVVTIRFEQEPLLGEGETPNNISQYPLEDILDYANVYVSDFYHDLNNQSEKYSYLELCGHSISEATKVIELAGKHVYNIDDGFYSRLIIE